MLVRRKNLKKEKIVFNVSKETREKWDSILDLASKLNLEIDQDELLIKSLMAVQRKLESLVPEVFNPAPSDPGNHKEGGSESGSWTSERRTGDERTKGGNHQEE